MVRIRKTGGASGKIKKAGGGDKSEDEGYVKVCPKCKSINVKTNQQGGLAFFGLPTFYTCEDCGFTNNFFPEVRVDSVRR